MDLKELKIKVEELIKEVKDNGNFPKENNLIDYKLKLNIQIDKEPIENFLINFAKDIISFSNADGGIILIGIDEIKSSGKYEEKGLDQENIDLLSKIDLNQLSQKFEKITKVGVSIDLQHFNIGSKKLYYLLIQKHDNILIPINDFSDYKLKKGDIFYRASSKNEQANLSAIDFNRFLQIKANEKSKDFMEIWSKLLPEMVDINPREVLILNPIHNKIYGFNGKDRSLSSSDIEIDKDENGIFNILLNAISAGDIGKISDTEGKPLYKIVGELKTKSTRDFIYLTNLQDEIKSLVKYKFTNNQLKQAIKYLNWVKDDNFKIENPDENIINIGFSDYLWIDKLGKSKKVVFSNNCIQKLSVIIDNIELHKKIFGKELDLKENI
jgi:hypothetical protein